MKLLWLLAAMGLAACSPTAPAPVVVTRVVTQRISVPPQLLRNPAPPSGPKVNSASAVATWIVRLWADDQNKSDQLAALAKILPKAKP